jgi:hypothetical protein
MQNKMIPPKIIWQKWQDEIVDEIDNIDSEVDDDHNDEDNSKLTKQLVMVTPMGILPYNSANVCMKNFNLWTAHTNFTISVNIANLIENVDGVETLDVFTRYRFRIGIGQAFTDSNVMRYINNILYEYINEHNT